MHRTWSSAGTQRCSKVALTDTRFFHFHSTGSAYAGILVYFLPHSIKTYYRLRCITDLELHEPDAPINLCYLLVVGLTARDLKVEKVCVEYNVMLFDINCLIRNASSMFSRDSVSLRLIT